MGEFETGARQVEVIDFKNDQNPYARLASLYQRITGSDKPLLKKVTGGGVPEPTKGSQSQQQNVKPEPKQAFKGVPKGGF